MIPELSTPPRMLWRVPRLSNRQGSLRKTKCPATHQGCVRGFPFGRGWVSALTLRPRVLCLLGTRETVEWHRNAN
jgi:hypothetical protein